MAEAEVEPKANPNRPGAGAVIEAKMDKTRGAVATLLVQRGTLHVGDLVVAGTAQGRVKALFDDRGRRVKDAPPSFPVEVLGLSGVPAAGDRFMVVADERAARAMIEAAAAAPASATAKASCRSKPSSPAFASGAIKELNLIVKADVQGSVEPITNSLEKLGDQTETRAKVIHAGLGNVNVNDVNLAVASKAMIIAFNVKIEADARRAAELQGVSIREYSVIYTLVEDIEQMLTGMLEPRYEEVIHGHAEVRQAIKAGRTVIAGCMRHRRRGPSPRPRARPARRPADLGRRHRLAAPLQGRRQRSPRRLRVRHPARRLGRHRRRRHDGDVLQRARVIAAAVAMPSRRIERINHLLRQEIADLLTREVKDETLRRR